MPQASQPAPLRRLAHFAKPEPGESLASWIDRGACETDLQRRDAWVRLGLTTNTQTNPVAYGVDLTSTAVRNLMVSTGLAPADVSALLLRRFDGVALSLDTLDLRRPERVRPWARAAWAFVWPSHACPQCVQDSGGVWQLTWKLPWSFACVHHGRYLISVCPECGERLQSNTPDRRQQLICCSSTPDVTRGRWDGAPRRRRHSDDVCGFPVGDAISPDSGGDARAMQRQVNAWLTPEPKQEARRAEAAASLQELRGLIPLMLYLGSPELLEGCDDVVRDRFDEHVAEREDDVPRRGPEAVAKYRQYTLAPTEPLLMAGALHVAVRLARSTDLATDWSWFVDTVASAMPSARTRWTQLDKFYKPPARHARALRQARDRRSYAVSAALDGRARHAEPAHRGLDSRHVPALLWPGAYEHLAPGLIESGWPVAGRRFAAMALARTLEPSLSTWQAAATALGLPENVAAHCNTLSSRFRQQGTGPVLDERLAAITSALADRPDRIDYAARRSHFADLDDLAPQDWAEVCDQSGVDPHGKFWAPRRQQAAAWLWEVLTGGDWHDAPALRLSQLPQKRREVVSNAYVSYFTAKHLQHIEEPLLALGRTLLERAGLTGAVRLDIRVPPTRPVQ